VTFLFLREGRVQSEAQALLDIVSDITSKDLIKINPSKSELVPLTKRHSDLSLCMDTEEIKQSSAHVGATTLMFPISALMFERSSAFSMLLLYLLYKTVESFAPCLIPCFTSTFSDMPLFHFTFTNHYREMSNELFIITLDAQKAFDKVNHELLFNKLYHDGIQGDLWILLWFNSVLQYTLYNCGECIGNSNPSIILRVNFVFIRFQDWCYSTIFCRFWDKITFVSK
jgi:hypothetical protein